MDIDICLCSGKEILDSSGNKVLCEFCMDCLRYRLHKSTKEGDTSTYFQEPPINDTGCGYKIRSSN